MESYKKVVSLATFLPDLKRNKKVVGPTNFWTLYSNSLLLQTKENGYFSHFSLVLISFFSFSLEPNIALKSECSTLYELPQYKK
jgi:hypothetical protein